MGNIIKFLLILVFHFNCTVGISQNDFEKIYYMGNGNIDHSIIETSDQNFLFAAGGHTPGNDHSYFVKIDTNGDIIWLNDFLNQSLASGKWVAESNDSSYILLGEESYYDPLAISLRKVTSDGILKWSFKYPDIHTHPYHYYSTEHFVEAYDSSVIVVGNKYAGGSTQCLQ